MMGILTFVGPLAMAAVLVSGWFTSNRINRRVQKSLAKYMEVK
jgi:hypothetical protein